ncbi:MAG: phosphoserine phosphatase SerB [Rikenellaceae bacterium]
MAAKNIEIIQINISGVDRPGVTSALTGILATYKAFILDIGQANIHQSLALGILFKTTSDKAGDIMKDLLFKAYELDVNIKFTPIAEEHYLDWVSMQGKNRHIIMLLGRMISAEQISAVSEAVSSEGLNIDAIRRLTGRIHLDEKLRVPKSCIELSVRGNLNDKSMIQAKFIDLSKRLGIDISFQRDDMFRRTRRLICFDMDSTLIKTEVIDELAIRAGVGDKVKAITESAMRGEIDFNESFVRRVAMLEGLDVSVMKQIAESLPITEGLERLMMVLKRVGFKTAILSGGFTYFGEYLQKRYGFDYMYANELEIEDGRLTGRHIGDIIDGKRKAELLKVMAQVEHINIAQVVAVGDGDC